MSNKAMIAEKRSDAVISDLADGGEKRFTVGTLSYTKYGLWVLFMWLMWNDFTIMLMEQVTTVNNLMLQKLGASYTLIAAFGSVAGFAGMWINPFFSTWSDRTRTRFGRRRPFLFVAVPVFALSLMAIPFAPDLYHYLVPGTSGADAARGETWFLGTAAFISTMFNMVVLALFSYYYWDVVPGSVLGRFQAMGRVVTGLALFVWNRWVFGHAEHHPKTVYVAVSLFCLAVYLVSVWRVKEGEYPPPEPRSKSGVLEPLRAYFKDCFSQSFFLWIFVGQLLFQLSCRGNDYMQFYLINDLKMSYQDVGWVASIGQGFSTIFGLVLGFAVGSMTDRLRPLRVLPVILLVRAVVLASGYLFVKDKTSAMILYTVNEGFLVFLLSVAQGAATVELFPLEKLGQFCSAQAFFYQTILIVGNPLIGRFFDVIQHNRFSYIWAGVFQFLAGLVYIKVYSNWKAKKREEALPGGGATVIGEAVA